MADLDLNGPACPPADLPASKDSVPYAAQLLAALAAIRSHVELSAACPAEWSIGGIALTNGDLRALLAFFERSWIAIACSRCSRECVDFRQLEGERVCILCVSAELDQARADAVELLHAVVVPWTATVDRVRSYAPDQFPAAEPPATSEHHTPDSTAPLDVPAAIDARGSMAARIGSALDLTLTERNGCPQARVMHAALADAIKFELAAAARMRLVASVLEEVPAAVDVRVWFRKHALDHEAYAEQLEQRAIEALKAVANA